MRAASKTWQYFLIDVSDLSLRPIGALWLFFVIFASFAVKTPFRTKNELGKRNPRERRHCAVGKLNDVNGANGAGDGDLLVIDFVG